jgi:hypothetical protein
MSVGVQGDGTCTEVGKSQGETEDDEGRCLAHTSTEIQIHLL